MDEFMNKIIDIGATSGGKIVLAIIVLVVGLFLIKLITRGVNKHVEKSKMDPTVKLIVTKLVKILLYVVLVVGLIEILGVPMTSVAALIASGGRAVGLGFQGALANLAGGFLILIFKPFKVGDYINAADAEGIVRDISIFYTKLLTLDNKTVLIPNGDLMSSNVTNLTAEPIRRIDLDFKITNDIDQNFVKSVLLSAAAADRDVRFQPLDIQLRRHVPRRPEPQVGVEYPLHQLGFLGNDLKLLGRRIGHIPERRRSAAMHPLAFRGGNLVADALRYDLALVLREGDEDVQEHSP